MKQWMKKAGFTIELSLLMPMILFVILFVMYMSFYLYNKEAITVIASAATLKGIQMEQEGARRIQQELEAFIQKEIEEKLLFMERADWTVDVTMASVKVTVEIRQKTPFRPLTYRATQKMNRIHPISILWETERIQK